MSRVSIVLAFLALALGAIAPSAQDAPQLPRIRVSTRLVQVDVIVRDKNGPVANLTKDDFVVLDRGKPRGISLFSIESGNSENRLVQPLPQTLSQTSAIRSQRSAKPYDRVARQFEYPLRFRADAL